MDRIKQRVAKWTEGRAPAEIAARTVGVIAIVVVPGAWAVWFAWRLLRPRHTAHLVQLKMPALAECGRRAWRRVA